MVRLGAATARLTFGALAVWCLGCRSFEPLIGRLLADHGDATSSVAISGTTDAGAPATTEPASEIEPGGECGCIDCAAVETHMTPAAAPRAIVPESFETKPQAPASVVREPLVPPPIGRSAV